MKKLIWWRLVHDLPSDLEIVETDNLHWLEHTLFPQIIFLI